MFCGGVGRSVQVGKPFGTGSQLAARVRRACRERMRGASGIEDARWHSEVPKVTWDPTPALSVCAPQGRLELGSDGEVAGRLRGPHCSPSLHT